MKDYSNLDSFVILMCIDGQLELEHKNKIFTIAKGEILLLPANINQIEITTDSAVVLEVYL